MLPAATEIVAALGIADRLVGRSHECDEPEAVTTLPALTAPRIDPTAPSREIHEQVGAAIEADNAARNAAAACGTGMSAALYTLDIDRLANLAPDLILSQAACDVCAISAADVESAARKSRVHTRVLSLSPTTLEDVFQDVLAVGEATGRMAKAREVTARLRARCVSVSCRVRALHEKKRGGPDPSPDVAVIEWLDPPMAAGNWVPEIVRLAGGNDVLGKEAAHSHWINWDDVKQADPDVIVLIPCGFPLNRVLTEIWSPTVWPHLRDLRAVREGRAWAIDGHSLFNRPGPRLVDSLEVLAEVLHPGEFAFAATRRFARQVGRGVAG